MSLPPKSPRISRSPKFKAKWLSSTLAYHYGSTKDSKNEIIVLSNDLDQYLQDIFHSLDNKGKGKITFQEFKFLCDVLSIKEDVTSGLSDDVTFSEFHARLCERFACYGDFTGFLVNQNFRSINATENSGKVDRLSKRTEFQKKFASSKAHKCIHDTEIFKNWDKLRLSGFRLSEIREHIDTLLFETAFHKEESQSLREIIEDLRSMLQSSDAQNLAMQVQLKKVQHIIGKDADEINRSSRRLSLPSDGLVYKPLKGEDRSLRILARELTQLRELRDKEVNELIGFNNQLQNDLTDLSREVCRLEDENKQLQRHLDSIVNTYKCCRQLFAICVESFREVEASSDREMKTVDTTDDMDSRSLERPARTRSVSKSDAEPAPDRVETPEHSSTESCSDDSEFPDPEQLLIKRLEWQIKDLKQELKDQAKENERLAKDMVACRRHMESATFQMEALETECSRLLSMEDQLVSVFTLLQKGRTQCLSRKTLGQLLLDVIDSSFGQDEQDMTADQFLRCLQQTLTECPLLMFSA